MYAGGDSIVLLTLRVSAHELWCLVGCKQEHQQCSEEWLQCHSKRFTRV